jgi:hypothetical protein
MAIGADDFLQDVAGPGGPNERAWRIGYAWAIYSLMAVLSSGTLNSVVVCRGVCNHASEVGARPCFSGNLGWVRSRA